MEEKHTYRLPDSPDNLLPEALRVNPFAVPDGYFDGLQQNILLQCHMAGVRENAREGVPAGYFEYLTDRIFVKIEEQKLRERVSETGFTVPDGYFGQLENRVLSHLKVSEVATETGFVVPAAYFETLPARIAEKTSFRKKTPVRNITRKWLAYAAAACVALTVVVAGISQLSFETEHASPSHLASVSDQDIVNYLELYGTDDDVLFISEQLHELSEQGISEDISADEIEAYLNQTL